MATRHEHDEQREHTTLDRRAALKLAAAAAVGASLDVREVIAGAQAGAATGGRFLSPEEFAFLDELAETIIPADSHSPGARAANVAAFIDGQLAEAWAAEERNEWRAGLNAINTASQRSTGKSFMDASPAERIKALTTLSEKEDKPETDAERFFVTLKARVAFAYYTSEIGIVREMEYKGNTYQTEYAGYDVTAEKR